MERPHRMEHVCAADDKRQHLPDVSGTASDEPRLAASVSQGVPFTTFRRSVDTGKRSWLRPYAVEGTPREWNATHQQPIVRIVRAHIKVPCNSFVEMR
eukprot:9492147-Pyramimonas_sp.AAC.1